nr:hypothetical protein OH837_19700 [Streptomyces canus]
MAGGSPPWAGSIPGIITVSVDVMLAEPLRYWLDRDRVSGLGEFHAPTLL